MSKGFNIALGGKLYTGWTGFSIGRSMERASGEFDIELARQKDDGDLYINGDVKAGQAVQINLGGDLYLDGYLGALAFRYDAQSSTVRVTGGDKVMDLVQCAASVNGPFEFTGIKLDDAIRRVIKPYGIKLTVDADVGAPFPRLAIQPGESAHDFIERACRLRQVLPLSDGIGGLILTKPGSEKSTGRLIYGDNILSADVSIDESEMFSLYVIKGQAEPSYPDEDDVTSTVHPTARVSDTTVNRYRPKLIVGENQAYDMTLKERVLWERKMARARSRRASYTVVGWHTDIEKQSLWRLNTLVPVQDDRTGLNREMLIAGLRFNYYASTGTTTQLELVMPEAFDIPAEVQDKGSANDIWVADND